MELNGIQDPVVPSTVIKQSSRTPSQENSAVPLSGSSAISPREQPEEKSLQNNTARDPVSTLLIQQEFPPNTRLHLDEESNRIVAQVLDENNQVIRQIPSEELLDISVRFNRLEGILFDEQR